MPGTVPEIVCARDDLGWSDVTRQNVAAIVLNVSAVRVMTPPERRLLVPLPMLDDDLRVAQHVNVT